MCRNDRNAKAFTLVELLVVIAIIALLVSLLVPVLGRAKSLAQRAVCLTNIRAIGTAIHTFAAAHKGRGPGGCSGPGTIGTGSRGRGWAGTINVEVLGQSKYWDYSDNRPFIECQMAWNHYPGGRVPRGRISCPSIVLYGGRLWPREWTMNRDVTGGPNWQGSGHGPEGPYGLMATRDAPPPIRDDYVTGWDYYYLGAELGNFRNPSYKFLVMESEAGNDVVYASWPAAAPHTVPVNGDPAIPPYSGLGGAFAFRHVLPRDKRLYQTQATGTFLFIDNHVGILTPNDKINAYDRFQYVGP